ncbi:39S ribosomal protein L48, mitochondrial [Halotydeus destructor]|nr:39S ribosomal protein L48, mitochondrial [Halotydeus destructor]
MFAKSISVYALNQTQLRYLFCLRPAVTRHYATKPKEPDPLTYVPKTTYIKDIHEPKYLEYLKPRIPYYDIITLQVKGYDFTVLEEYTSFVQKVAKQLGIKENKYWASPCVTTKYDTFQPSSEVIESSYKVNIFERNVQFKHMTSRQAPLLIGIVQQAKPAGVTISVHPHDDEQDLVRYIPDLQLEELEKELEDWKRPTAELQQSKF